MNTKTNLALLGILLAAAVNGAAQPTLTCQPSNQTAIAGSTVTFTVCANGTGPLSFLLSRNERSSWEHHRV